MRRVLLIRPLEDALPLARVLREKGIEPLLYPLFNPRFLPLPPLKNPQALIITSKNALRAIEKLEALKKIPLYVVGDQTAELAHHMGFLNILNASGTAQDLIPLILHNAQPHKGILWYLSGDIIKSNIVEDLRSKGFQAERQIIYQIEEVETLPPPLLLDLQNQKISHVMFFSSHTTAIFINLLKKKGLEETTFPMTSLCLSEDVAEKAKILKWKEIWVSPKPTTQNMTGYFDDQT